MAIAVICPGCKQSFRVSDKFAGKQGPCPKCKAVITIPAQAAEVKIHAPQEYASGGKDSQGRPTAKPIRRKVTKYNRLVVIGGLAATVVIVAAAWLMGEGLRTSVGFRAIGLLVVTPPVVALGYLFFRDQEKLQFFTGSWLWIRVAICSAVYIALWIALGWVQQQFEFPQEVWQWFIIAPPMVILATLAPLGCFDMEFGNAFLHYAFYVFIVLALRMVAGMPHLWELGL